MPQVEILRGIFADGAPNLRTGLPRNLVPVPKSSGVSDGYLRPGDGLVHYVTGPGRDRGGVGWNGDHYRVMGERMVRIDGPGAYTDLGLLPGIDRCVFAFSFDKIAIVASNRMFYFDGTQVQEVTDPDLGAVISVEWVDGMFAMTDGTSIPVTDLADPYSINPLRYGSSEADADPIVALIRLRNELHAVNRYSVEVFQNVGGSRSPLQRTPSAFVGRGAIGTHACCLLGEFVAVVGGARNEALAVWLLANGTSAKISTREIDTVLEGYTPDELQTIVLEARSYRGHEHLYLHLPDKTLLFDARASLEMKTPIWCQLDSGVQTPSLYRAIGFVEHSGSWYAGDPSSNSVCVVDTTISSHYGSHIQHEFGTAILYLDGNSGIVHEIELVTLPGSVKTANTYGVIYTSHSSDGQTYSQEVSARAPGPGEAAKRIGWRTCGQINNWRVQRFRWLSDVHVAVLRLNVAIEPLRTRPG